MPYQRFIFDETLKFPSNLKQKMLELDEVAHKVLKLSKDFGKTYIVTNAAEGWVAFSAGRFLRKTFEELQKDIVIIPARTKFEKLYPKNYQKWKVEAFMETRRDLEDNALTNLIAMGDNMFEIEAAHQLGAKYS